MRNSEWMKEEMNECINVTFNVRHLNRWRWLLLLLLIFTVTLQLINNIIFTCTCNSYFNETEKFCFGVFFCKNNILNWKEWKSNNACIDSLTEIIKFLIFAHGVKEINEHFICFRLNITSGTYKCLLLIKHDNYRQVWKL